MSTATGLGSGVVLIWIWNTFIAAYIDGAQDGPSAMPAEVGAVVATSAVALFERWVK